MPSPPTNSYDTASDALMSPVAGRTGHFLGRHPLIRRWVMRLIDALIVGLAFALAYLISFLDLNFPAAYRQQFLYMLPYVIVVRLVLLQVFGLYRGFTRYTGLHEVVTLFVACGLASALLFGFNFATDHIFRLPGSYPIHRSGDHILRMPWRVLILDWLLANFGVTAVRIARRVFAERLLLLRSGKARRMLIVGTGDAGEQVVRDLLRTQLGRFRPVGFVDPDPIVVGRRIHGVPVLGTLEQMQALIIKHRVEMVVVALPRPTPRLLQGLVDQCHQARVEFKIIPDLERMLEGRVQISQLRSVEIEDLLGRPPITVSDFSERSCVRGKRVLITGAGGSIGSELCRQALAQRAAGLVLLGRGENSLYDIQNEVGERAREQHVPLEVVVGNVTDEALLKRLFARIKPEVVLHAAAHKHVHFMEAQPAEAIKNNVMGTRLVAQTALAAGVERFIMISTDKAVRPTGVMGASKRVAEMIVSSLNEIGPTHFIAVRFGNVLGSRGSVIPLFRKQIAKGGPVTVTHPDVTRYFMTIPEAVSLVLQAGTVGAGGEVYLLDMGQPVKIVDLARRLITLSGLEPGTDIAIEFTGMRPGEKLFEELLTAEQARVDTEHGKIFRSDQPVHPWTELAPRITQLEGLALAGDTEGIKALLHELIPDYLGANSAASLGETPPAKA